MYKKFFALNLLFIVTFSFLGCQNEGITTNSVSQKIEGGSSLEPTSLENILKIGSIKSLQKITFKNGQLSLTPQQIVKDGTIVYPPLMIHQELNLADGTKIRIENNQAIIQIPDEHDKQIWALSDGQSFYPETNTIAGE